jgi:sialidase-1
MLKFKRMKNLLYICLLMGVFASCTPKENMLGPDVIAIDNPIRDLDSTDAIFKRRSEGYFCFRIPAIVKTKEGTLLAFAEARKNNCSDEDDIDLVLKRSTDGGKTWGPLMVVWSDGNNTCGNPSPIVDQVTGRVVLLMTWNLGTDKIGTINDGTSTDTRRVFITYSTDDGLNWDAPKEITNDVKKPEWGWYATGPVHGLQIQSGPHKNRMVIPCDYIELRRNGGKGFSHVIYSDDLGDTWHIGGISPNERANESTVAELSDGRLMLNMRATGRNARWVAESEDAGLSWKNMRTDYNLVEPVCQGSLLDAYVNGQHTLFFSNPASTARENMTIKMSTNNGGSWDKYVRIHAGPSAYSDIVMINDQTVGILYEGGIANPYETITFREVPVTLFK